ncbi:MAG: hypothetical protein ACKPKO_02565, partial [Candidatus Fonsibacter sp.]
NQILEIGRHFNIHCIVKNHRPTNGKDNRQILNEAHTVTYFPHSAGGKIKYLLEESVGLYRKQIAYTKRQRPRACTIFQKQLPAVLLGAERDRSVGPRQRRGSARAGVICFWLLALMIGNIIRFQFAFRTSSRSLRVNMPFF